jgi:Aldehyde dehydrogenase family
MQQVVELGLGGGWLASRASNFTISLSLAPALPDDVDRLVMSDLMKPGFRHSNRWPGFPQGDPDLLDQVREVVPSQPPLVRHASGHMSEAGRVQPLGVRQLFALSLGHHSTSAPEAQVSVDSMSRAGPSDKHLLTRGNRYSCGMFAPPPPEVALLVGGDRPEGVAGERRLVFDPATGQPIASVAQATSPDVDRADRLVFDDADLSTCLASALWSVFDNAGQGCCARSRFLVQRTTYDRVVADLARMAAAIFLGNPLLPALA